MNPSLRRRFIVLFVCLALLFPAKPAKPESLHTAAVQIIVGIVLVTAAITTGIILAVRHNPTVTGCAVAGPDGLVLRNEGDQQSFLLTGDTAGFSSGERVKVQGKKKGRGAAGTRQFIVEKLKKDYGLCKAATATP